MKFNYKAATVFTFIILTLVSLINCSSETFSETENTSKNHLPLPNIDSKDISSWNMKEFHEDIQRYYFSRADAIYGIKSEKFVNSFYKTSDDGKTWEKLSSINNLDIYGFTFISPKVGFICVSDIKPSSTSDGKKSYIMKTEDGGLSWKVVYSSANIIFYKLDFDSNNVGLAVGRKDVFNSQRDSENLILLTGDAGKSWNDISENLNRKTVKSDGLINESLYNFIFSGDKGIVALSSDKRIFNSLDKGKTWNAISEKINEANGISFNLLGELDNGKLWTGGGTMATEGTYGAIAITDGSGWSQYIENNYFFSDVEFLSNNEVVAVGSVFSPDAAENANRARKGIILYSSDSGKDWSTVYESQISKMFVSITGVSENKFFIAGDNKVGGILERNISSIPKPN